MLLLKGPARKRLRSVKRLAADLAAGLTKAFRLTTKELNEALEAAADQAAERGEPVFVVQSRMDFQSFLLQPTEPEREGALFYRVDPLGSIFEVYRPWPSEASSLGGVRVPTGVGTETVEIEILPIGKAALAKLHGTCAVSGDGTAIEKQVRLCKSSMKKGIVYGVVYEPFKVDLQGDWSDPEEIESAAHDFLAKHASLDVMHSVRAASARMLQIVESWVTKSAERIGEEEVTPGT